MNPDVEKFLAEPEAEPDDAITKGLGIIARTLGLLDVAAAVALTIMSLSPRFDPALNGLGVPLGWLIAALFALTALPGLVIAWFGWKPRTALGLVITFPLCFILMYVALILAFPT